MALACTPGRPLRLCVFVSILLLHACQSSSRRSDLGFDDLHLISTSGALRFEAEGRDERRKAESGDLEKQEVKMREELLLRFLGFFYHPKFLEFDLQTQFGLEQRDTQSDSGGAERSTDRQILDYDLSVGLFKDKPYSGEVYSRRKVIETRQNFFDTTEATTSQSGMRVRAKDWVIPSRMHAFHSAYEGRGFDTYQESRDVIEIDGARMEESANYTYGTRYANVEQGSADQSIEDVDLRAASTHRFGQKEQSVLDNTAWWRSQVGTISNENAGFTTAYRRDWLESLSSDMRIQLNRSESGEVSTNTKTLSAGLTHRLYQSLTSRVTGQVGRASIDSGEIDTYGTGLAFDYRKQTPIGRLGLRFSKASRIQDQGLLQGLVVVLDESQTYEPGTPLLLRDLNVDHASVVVTDASGLVLYSMGVDYNLSRIGSQTEILIPIGSLIQPGQSILIDYQYAPTPAQKLRSRDQFTGMTFSILDTVDLSLSVSELDQKVLAGLETENLEQSQRKFASVYVHSFGASLGGEYEDVESNHSPYERVRFTASYWRTISGRGFWNLALSSFETRFKSPEGIDKGSSASFSIGSSVGRNSSVELRGEYRELEQRSDKGRGSFFELSYDRRFRSIAFHLEARYSQEEFDIADDNDLAVLRFAITRSF